MNPNWQTEVDRRNAALGKAASHLRIAWLLVTVGLFSVGLVVWAADASLLVRDVPFGLMVLLGFGVGDLLVALALWQQATMLRVAASAIENGLLRQAALQGATIWLATIGHNLRALVSLSEREGTKADERWKEIAGDADAMLEGLYKRGKRKPPKK